MTYPKKTPEEVEKMLEVSGIGEQASYLTRKKLLDIVGTNTELDLWIDQHFKS